MLVLVLGGACLAALRPAVGSTQDIQARREAIRNMPAFQPNCPRVIHPTRHELTKLLR
jgi:hypothetical protein